MNTLIFLCVTYLADSHPPHIYGKLLEVDELNCTVKVERKCEVGKSPIVLIYITKETVLRGVTGIPVKLSEVRKKLAITPLSAYILFIPDIYHKNERRKIPEFDAEAIYFEESPPEKEKGS